MELILIYDAKNTVLLFFESDKDKVTNSYYFGNKTGFVSIYELKYDF